MKLYHYLLIVMAALVCLQIVMTRLYGWWGLAYTTTVWVLLILGGPAVLSAWLNSYSDVVAPPRMLVELAVGLLFFMPLTLLVPPFVVLVAFLLLALTVKTE